MPSTINGVGTTYYGKANFQSHSGLCEHCKSQVVLSSYETRLWFVVLFIPVIPLGKKQILDQCSRCMRHRVAPLGEWEEAGENALLQVLQKAAEKPDDPDAALEMLGALVAFQKRQEAEQYADEIASRFPDNVSVQFQLGAWHDQAGRNQKADACFERALEIEPDNRLAARAVGVGCIQKGDLTRARALLSFMEAPGPDQDPVVLAMLADAYHASGDDKSAVELYELAMEARPSLARDKKLRKRAKAAAAAVGMPESIIPESPGHYGRWVTWVGLAAALIAGVFWLNHYMASSQTLHLVNRLGEQVTVVIDDGGDPVVVGQNLADVTISEGRHRAVIQRADGSEETVDFEIENGLFQRFFKDSVFVLNVAGAADLIWEETVYSATPNPNEEFPYEIHFGEEFFTFRDIDYAFEEFPDELTTESSRVTKARVGLIDAPPLAILASFPKGTPPDEMLRFAEHHLARNPAEEMLLQIYVAVATGMDELDRCRAFLEKGLSREPVQIEWHRMYQETAQSPADEEAMIARYDQLLDGEPENSGLLYLRGRLAPRATEAAKYFDRAIAADPENAYPYFAKAYQLDANGEFSEAKQLAAKACELMPDHMHMTSALFEIRYALGEYGALEKELRESLEGQTLNVSAQQRLLRVLVADGRPDEAQNAHETFAQKVRQNSGPDDPAETIAQSTMSLQYLTGDLEGWLETAQQFAGPDDVGAGVAVAQLELGNVDEAEKTFASIASLPEGYRALLLSLAWRQKGDDQKADHWRQKAIDTFAAGKLDEAFIADLLKKGDQLELEEIEDVSAHRTVNAILLVALSDKATTHRNALLTRAEKINLVAYFPYRFLKRTIEAMKS